MLDGARELDDRPEFGRERQRDPLVAAGDARADDVRVGGEPAELRCLDPVGGGRGRDLEPRTDRFARARVERQPLEQRGSRDTALDGGQGVGDRRNGGVQGRPGDADPAAWLTVAVEHCLLPQPEAEPVDVREDRVVPEEDELGTHLHDGAVSELA